MGNTGYSKIDLSFLKISEIVGGAAAVGGSTGGGGQFMLVGVNPGIWASRSDRAPASQLVVVRGPRSIEVLVPPEKLPVLETSTQPVKTSVTRIANARHCRLHAVHCLSVLDASERTAAR